MLTIDIVIDPDFYQAQLVAYASDLAATLQKNLQGQKSPEKIKNICIHHFNLYGENRGISPAPWFDTKFYCQVSRVNATLAWQHFLSKGISEGLSPSAIFDVPYYADIAQVTYEKTVEHFLTEGLDAGYNPSPFFDLDFYMAVVNSKITREAVLRDYVLIQKPKGVSPSPYFDIDYYQRKKIRLNEKIEASEALDTFILSDEAREITPSPFFSNDYYCLQLTFDEQQNIIPTGRISAIRHFLVRAKTEKNLSPCVFIDILYYCAQTSVAPDQAVYHFLMSVYNPQKNTTPNPISPSPIFDVAFFERQIIKGQYQVSASILASNNTALIRCFLMTLENLADDIPVLDPCAYFNTDYYCNKVTGVKKNDAAAHFLMVGCIKGENPSLYFHTQYCANRATVSCDEVLRDFLIKIKNQVSGLCSAPFFDNDYYVSQLPGGALPDESMSAVEHFVNTQIDQVAMKFYSPSPFYNKITLLSGKAYENFLIQNCTDAAAFDLFDSDYYTGQLTGDARDTALLPPLLDFVWQGAEKGLDPHALFSNIFYKQQLAVQNPQALQAITERKTTAIRHYCMQGGKQPLVSSASTPALPIFYDPCMIFDSASYVAVLPKNTISQHSSLLGYFLSQPLVLDKIDLSCSGNLCHPPFVFFDVYFYASAQGVALENSYKHFLEIGINKGLDPSPFFSTDYYTLTNALESEPAFFHFSKTGPKAHSPCPFFNTEYYLQQLKIVDSDAYTRIQNGLESALHYYITVGAGKYPKLNSSPFFDTQYYLDQLSETEKASIDPSKALYHYLIIGETKGYIPTPYFDSAFYCSQLSEDKLALIQSKSISALRHYLIYGARAKLSPNPFIDIHYYAAIVKKTLGKKIHLKEAVNHYFLIGQAKHISPSPLFDEYYYTTKYVNSISKTRLPFDDFIHFGLGQNNAEEREPSPNISFKYYQRTAGVTKNFARHFLTIGIQNGKNPSIYFDISFCSQKYSVSNEETLRDFLLNRLPNDQVASAYFDAYYFQHEHAAEVSVPQEALAIYRLNYENDVNVNPSPYFEKKFYKKQLSKKNITLHNDMTLVEHFESIGVELDLDPCGFFETNFYSKTQKVEKKRALQHYILQNNTYIVDTSLFFNANFYSNFLKKNNVKLKKFNKTLLYYFLTIGELNNDSPSIVFEVDFYLAQLLSNNDEKKRYESMKISAIRYMLFEEMSDQYSPNLFFNPSHYKAQIARSFTGKAIRDYMTHGDLPHCNVSIYFDNEFYSQVLTAKPSSRHVALTLNNKTLLLVHFLEYGEQSGYNCFPFYEENYYKKQLSHDQRLDELKGINISVLRHCLTIGIPKYNYDPSQFFESTCYRAELAAVANLTVPSDMLPLEHYLSVEEKNNSITPSYYFDPDFYKSHAGVAAEASEKGISLIRHFFLYGDKKKFEPLPFFDSTYFIGCLNPVEKKRFISSKLSPIRYFLIYANEINIAPGPFFDSFFFSFQIKEVALSMGDLFYRFLSQEESNSVSCSPFFDPEFYTNKTPSVIPPHISAIRYFLVYDKQDEQPSVFVDKDYYASQNSKFTTSSSYRDILVDFITHQMNMANGNKITLFFDDDFYQQSMPENLLQDWKNSQVSLLRHFLTKGISMGISPTAIFDNDFYKLRLPVDLVNKIENGTTSAIREFMQQGNSALSSIPPSPFFDDIYYAMNTQIDPLTKNSIKDLKGRTCDLVRAFIFFSLTKPVVQHSASAALFSPAPFVDMEYYAFSNNRNSLFTDYASAFRFFIVAGKVIGESSSSLFFKSFYLEQLQELDDPDAARVEAGDLSAIEHYLTIGKTKNYLPTPLLDLAFYSNNLKSAGITPPATSYGLIQYYFYNYVASADTYIQATPYFDNTYYEAQVSFYSKRQAVEQNSDVDNPVSGMRHFLNVGQAKGLNPSTKFNTRFYGTKNGVPLNNALQDFLVRGEKLQLNITPYPVGLDVSQWQTTLGNTLPLIVDWMFAANFDFSVVIYTFSSSNNNKMPFLISVNNPIISNNPQAYYQVYAPFVELFLAYKRVSSVIENSGATSIENSAQISLTLDNIFSTDKNVITGLQNIFTILNNLDYLIIQQGIHSASRIASLSLSNFQELLKAPATFKTPFTSSAIFKSFQTSAVIEKSSDHLSDNTEVNHKIYHTAKRMVADISLNYLNAYQTFSPYVQSVTGNVLNTVSTTNYQQIFGSMDYYRVDSNIAIDSPAAYLFDLMRIIQERFVESGVSSLEIRRPDIYEIPLDVQDTFGRVLYLAIVNYVLACHFLRENKKSISSDSMSYNEKINAAEEQCFALLITQALNQNYLSNTLFNPPCALSLESSRIYLSQMNTSLFDVYSAINVNDNDLEKFDDYSVAQEYLGISAAEILWLDVVLSSFKSNVTDAAILNQFIDSALITSDNIFLCQSRDFFSYLQSTREQCEKLIPYEENVTSETKSYYINAGDAFPPMAVSVNYNYKVETIQNVSLIRLKRIALSLFFAKKLSCTVDEVQSIMNILNIVQPSLDVSTRMLQLENDIKMLALLQSICKKSGLALLAAIQTFIPLTIYEYQKKIKSTQANKRTKNFGDIADYSGNDIMTALKKLLSIPANAIGLVAQYLTDQEVTHLNQVVAALRITYADFGLLVNNDLLKHFYSNGTIFNWLTLVVNVAKLCGVSIITIFQLYHLIVANDASNYSSLLQGLYAYLVKDNSSTRETVYKISLLFSLNQWFKENQLSIDAIYKLLYASSSGSVTTSNQAQLKTTLSALLHAFLKSPVPKTQIMSYLDSQVCQALADNYKTDFQTITQVFMNITIPNAEQHIITCLVFGDPSLLTIGKNPDKKTADLVLIDNLNLNIQVIDSLGILMQLVNLFNLSATNAASGFNDIDILCKLVSLKINGYALTFQVSLDAIKYLVKLKKLKNTFQSNANQFLVDYKIPTSNFQDNDAFLFFAEWDISAYNALCHLSFPHAVNDKNLPDICIVIDQISWLIPLYDVLKKLSYNTSIFSVICDISKKSDQLLADQNPDLMEEYLQKNETLMNQVMFLIRQTNEDGKNVLYELTRQIEVRKRDVLVVSLLQCLNAQQLALKMPVSISPDIFGRKTQALTLKATDLSEYILLDVQTTGAVDTSFIAQATLSLQWYLQRCRLGLEILSDSSQQNLMAIPVVWWQWIENYRLWQANRKILIYPENYIDPGLCTNSSPEFTTFTQTVSQAGLTSDNIQNAFNDYFHKVYQLSSLTYIAACQQPSANAIYLFACTATDPLQYYYRTMTYEQDSITGFLVENKIKWGYWNKISISINAQLITPIYAFGRLFIFWVETKYKVSNATSVHPGDSTTTAGAVPQTVLFDYKILYTYQNTNGTWQIPQTIVDENNKQINDFFVASGINNDRGDDSDDASDNTVAVSTTINAYPAYIDSQYIAVTSDANLALSPSYLRINWVSVQYDSANMTINIAYPQSELMPASISFYPVQYSLDRYFSLKNSTQTQLVTQSVNNTCLNHLLTPSFQTKNKGTKVQAYQTGTKKINTTLTKPLPPTMDVKPLLAVYHLQPKSSSSADVIAVQGSNASIISTSGIAYLVVQSQVNQKTQALALSSIQAMQTMSQPLFGGALNDFFANENSANLEDNFFDQYTGDQPGAVSYMSNSDSTNISHALNFSGAFNVYYWEIFFFIPFYLANRLNSYQKFSDARDWYQRIFYPYRFSKSSSPMFLFPPFQTLNPLLDITSYNNILNASRDYPFDPQAIAQLRPIAYVKAIVMSYIKNLIDWGDQLFTQDTRETINQANNLYIMANDILGKNPQGLGVLEKKSKKTITIGAYYSDSDPPSSHSTLISIAFNPVTLAIFVFLENQLNNLLGTTSASISLSTIPQKNALTTVSFNDLNPFFSISENSDFIAYWDRASDRLLKIRYSQNINGIKQSLSLFSPPIDIRQLVRAAASGGLDINSFIGNSPVPVFRFNTLVSYAKDFIEQLIQLGNGLMSMLMQQDSENFNLLLNSQQDALFTLMVTAKQRQIDAATYEIDQIQTSIDSANQRYDYYTALVSNFSAAATSPDLLEQSARGLTVAAQGIKLIAETGYAIAAITGAIPQAQTGFAAIGPYLTLSEGGEQMSKTSKFFAFGLGKATEIMNEVAEDLLTEANYERRTAEWTQQATQAQSEATMYTQQLNAAEIRLKIAKNDYDTHQLSIQHLQDIQQFYQTKYGNLAFYQWMITQLMMLHQNVYRMGYALLQQVQRAYSYEVPQDSNNYLQSLSYNANYKGMLAGEMLRDQLNQFQMAYLNNNSRLLNVSKVISLKNLGVFYNKKQDYIQDFKKNGSINFSLTQDYFNADFDCQKNRRIKLLTVSVPALTGPYQSINLVLRRTDLNPSDYCGIQSEIVISTGENDIGTFDGMGSARYLPFEGTLLEGSSWTLEIGKLKSPAEDLYRIKQMTQIQSVSDVIITIHYLAEKGPLQGDVVNSDVTPVDNSASDLENNEAFAEAYQPRSALAGSGLINNPPPSYLLQPGLYPAISSALKPGASKFSSGLR